MSISGSVRAKGAAACARGVQLTTTTHEENAESQKREPKGATIRVETRRRRAKEYRAFGMVARCMYPVEGRAETERGLLFGSEASEVETQHHS